MRHYRGLAAIAGCTAAIGVLWLGSRPHHRSVSSPLRESEFPWHNVDGRDLTALITAGLVSALSTSAGIGGGPFFVPIINIIAGLDLKSTIAVSQAAVAGGSMAGVLCGLLSACFSGSNQQLLDFTLALQYGPLLFLGTSAGVVLTRSVPDWLIVIILFLMMAFLAVKVVTKGQEMYKAETRHAKAAVHPKEAAYHSQPAHEDAEAVEPASAPQAPESPPASPSPGQGERAQSPGVSQDPAMALASFPVDLGSDLMSTRSSFESGLTPVPSDDEYGEVSSHSHHKGHNSTEAHEAHQQSRLGKPRASPPPEKLPETPELSPTPEERPSTPELEQAPDLSGNQTDVQPNGMSPHKAVPQSSSSSGSFPWAAVLQGLLLAGVIVAFMVLQQQKEHFIICSRGYDVFYAAQAALCLLVSILSLALLRRSRAAVSDAEAPLLPPPGQPPAPRPLVSKPVAGLATVLGGAAAGLTGLGGGQVVSPLFLELGVPPQQAAATSLLLVLFNSAAAALQFALGGRLDTGYALVYAGLCFGASVLGYLLMARLITSSGHPSFLVFVLGIMLALGGLAVVSLGVLRVATDVREHGRLPGFDDLCP